MPIWDCTQAVIDTGMRSTFAPAVANGKSTNSFVWMIMRFPKAN